jgi:2-methylisocitrate lyase-like PEP mutase family enzyme
MTTQLERAEAFRTLHTRPGIFVMPNPWDAGSTKLLGSLGFEALATTSLGLAAARGRVDGTLAVSRDELIANCREIADATDLPVNADLENGYADAPEAAASIIRAAAEAGIVGGSIEDFSLAVERVAAAVEVARALLFPFTLTARAENLLHGRNDLDDTIRRLNAFADAGADALYAPGLRDLATIRRVAASVPRPLNVVMSSLEPGITVADLEAAGVKRVSIGGALARLAFTAVRDAALEMREHGTFGWMRGVIPSRDLHRIFESPPAPGA